MDDRVECEEINNARARASVGTLETRDPNRTEAARLLTHGTRVHGGASAIYTRSLTHSLSLSDFLGHTVFKGGKRRKSRLGCFGTDNRSFFFHQTIV